MNSTKQMKWFRVSPADAIPVKEGRTVQFQNYSVAVFNLGGEFRATDSVCPHRGGPLADGIVAGNAVFCPLHNWKINLENGCALSGGTGQIKTFPVKVMDGQIYVAFEEAQLKPCDSLDLASDIQAAKDMGG